MLMTKERRPPLRTLRGWAIAALNEAGAVREREEHGWMQDRTDPHVRERRYIARSDPPPRPCPDAAAAEVPGRVGFDRRRLPGVSYVGCLGRSYFGSSTNVTGVPLDTRAATRSASQFVRRTQPCDSDLDTFPGKGVPWMP
jgi:hypothetical protein